MYRALYRKWRPQRFEDVVGQESIVVALQNQISAGRIGHAYLFTGTRGTGKTSCAKIFAKAINCLDRSGPDPCGKCEVCRGIDDGSILDVTEQDAASNNKADDIHDVLDDMAFLPTICKYKVYIVDEVHMLSTSAFNAMLKTIEEPPEHVVFILATTEVQKIPATILSRCQRYDFGRIAPEKIAARLHYISEQESIELSPEAADLIARLADGAMRDALSILDTCAGVSSTVDEALVRQMAGVTDRRYLFDISDAIERKDAVSALQKIAELRQNSVDMRRLCLELTGHYRNLMLAALPSGEQLLSGVSPQEAQLYAQHNSVPQAEAVRAIEVLGDTLDKMARGIDQRIELELAVFSLTQTPAVAVSAPMAEPAATQRPAGFVKNNAAPIPFASAPVAVAPAGTIPPFEVSVATPQPALATPKTALDDLPEPTSLTAQNNAVPAASAGEEPKTEPYPDVLNPPIPPASKKTTEKGVQPAVDEYVADVPIPKPTTSFAQGPKPFAQWDEVKKALKEKGGLYASGSFLDESKAYFDGRRVLIECNQMFRDYMREKKDHVDEIKQAIFSVTGVKCGIGPYEPPKEEQKTETSVEETLASMRNFGVDVVVEDK